MNLVTSILWYHSRWYMEPSYFYSTYCSTTKQFGAAHFRGLVMPRSKGWPQDGSCEPGDTCPVPVVGCFTFMVGYLADDDIPTHTYYSHNRLLAHWQLMTIPWQGVACSMPTWQAPKKRILKSNPEKQKQSAAILPNSIQVGICVYSTRENIKALRNQAGNNYAFLELKINLHCPDAAWLAYTTHVRCRLHIAVLAANGYGYTLNLVEHVRCITAYIT